MACAVRRLRSGSALPLGCALAALCASPAAASDLRVFTPDTMEVSGDVRLVAVNGEKSWLDRGFGKLRSGSDGELRIRPELGNVDLVWKPSAKPISASGPCAARVAPPSRPAPG